MRRQQPARTVDARGVTLRTWPMNVRLNVEERRAVHAAARRAGKPPSVYVRDLVLADARNPQHRQLPRWLPE